MRIVLSTQAKKAYGRLARSDRKLFQRVESALDRLAENPELGKSLQGPLADRRSHRVGPLRIIYRHEADRLLIFVLDIAQRGRVYRDK